MLRYHPTTNKERRIWRHRRIRKTISGTAQRPRLCVFKSNRSLHVQIVNDEIGATILSVHEKNSVLRGEEETKHKKLARAGKTGEYIAQLAQKAGIQKVRFDRGGYRYAGRVKALAEGARKGGLIF